MNIDIDIYISITYLGHLFCIHIGFYVAIIICMIIVKRQ